MIELYGCGSPNVVKIAIMLEEIGRPYRSHHIAVMHGAQFDPAFLALNPIGKVPVIVDGDGADPHQPIFESGAILIYLAETYAPALLPAKGPARWEVLKWLIAQVAYAGPLLGQLNHFQLVAGQSDGYAANRYRDQAARVYGDIEKRLGVVPWLGGENYSIADIAMYPWAGYLARHGFDPAKFPKIMAWRGLIDDRPAVKRARAAIDAMAQSDPKNQQPLENNNLDRFFGRQTPGPGVDFPKYLGLGPFS